MQHMDVPERIISHPASIQLSHTSIWHGAAFQRATADQHIVPLVPVQMGAQRPFDHRAGYAARTSGSGYG
jgi:hypothetical protein